MQKYITSTFRPLDMARFCNKNEMSEDLTVEINSAHELNVNCGGRMLAVNRFASKRPLQRALTSKQRKISRSPSIEPQFFSIVQACGGSKYASVMNPLRLRVTAAFYLGSSLIFTSGPAAAKSVNGH